jgi:hypothetical protein
MKLAALPAVLILGTGLACNAVRQLFPAPVGYFNGLSGPDPNHQSTGGFPRQPPNIPFTWCNAVFVGSTRMTAESDW